MAALLSSILNPAEVQYATGNLTAAQINGMDVNHSPILILSPSGENTTYIVHAFSISSTRTIDFVGVASLWLTIGSLDTFDNSIVTPVSAAFLTTPSTGGGSIQNMLGDPTQGAYDYTTILNQALYLTAGAPITGGNGTLKYHLWYSVEGV